MGKEFPMAREEEERQPVLLASTSARQFIYASSGRNKRTQEPDSSQGDEGGKAEDIKTKSKGSRKVKGGNARHTKPKRRGRDYQDRESNRGDEGEDKQVGRSAQELGIVHPGSYCDDDKTVPHYWVEKENISGGSLYQCKLCHKYQWLPMHLLDAIRLGQLVAKYGSSEGYCRFLNKHRAAKVMLAKLQDLAMLEAEMADKVEFAKLADKILNDKEYDRTEWN